MDASSSRKPAPESVVAQQLMGSQTSTVRKDRISSFPISKRDLLRAYMLQELVGPPKSRQVISKISLMQEISPSETK